MWRTISMVIPTLSSKHTHIYKLNKELNPKKKVILLVLLIFLSQKCTTEMFFCSTVQNLPWIWIELTANTWPEVRHWNRHGKHNGEHNSLSLSLYMCLYKCVCVCLPYPPFFPFRRLVHFLMMILSLKYLFYRVWWKMGWGRGV